MTEHLPKILSLIDAANARDPNGIEVDGETRPAELVYGERMSARLAAFLPGAGEHLQIACRAQHLERWTLPRASYPMDLTGYHRWRNEQKRRHAARVRELMLEAGYDEADCARVEGLVRKKDLKRDPEAQALEDVACLVFLQYYAADFAVGREEDHLVEIVRKTWNKMSPAGQEAALALDLPEGVSALVSRALAA